jgi:hypothetical protein
MFGSAVNDSAVSDAAILVKLYGKGKALRLARAFCEPVAGGFSNEHWFAVVLLLNAMGCLRAV